MVTIICIIILAMILLAVGVALAVADTRMVEFVKIAIRVWKKIENGDGMMTAKEEIMEDFIMDWIDAFD